MDTGAPTTVIDVLRTRLAEDPAHPAFFVEVDGRWVARSRAEYCAAVRSLAAGMAAHGIERGDRVALIAGTRYEWEVADKAILSLGAVVVGIDVKSAPEDIDYIIQNAGISSAIVENEVLLNKLPQAFLVRAKLIIAIEPTAFASMDAVCLNWSDAARAPAADASWGSNITAEDEAVIIYTSGTTGRPKGIPFRHRHLVRGCPIMAAVFASVLTDTHVSIAWLPLSNGTGRFISLMGFYLGAHQYFVRDPLQIMAKIKTVNPTYMFGVPRFYEKVHDGIMAKLATQPPWVRLLIRAVLRLKSSIRGAPAQSLLDRVFIGKIRRAVFGERVRFMFCGSAPIDPKVLKFYDALGVPIYECYGVSESAILLAMNRPGRTKLGTVGPLLEGNVMKLADDGELLVKGDGLFSGYLGGDQSDLFDEEGYYRTGDLVRLDGDYLVLTGRKKEIIKTSTGLRISPVEIEQAYGRIEGIDQLVAIGNGRKFISALITLDSAAMRALCVARGIALDAAEELAHHLEVQRYVEAELFKRHQRLAEYKQIKKFAVLPVTFSPDSGELTPTMKLKRSAIEAKYKQEIDRLYLE